MHRIIIVIVIIIVLRENGSISTQIFFVILIMHSTVNNKKLTHTFRMSASHVIIITLEYLLQIMFILKWLGA